MDISGFQDLSELIRNPRFTIFRGKRAGDSAGVLLKVFHQDDPRAETESAILKSVEAEPGFLRPLDLLREGARTVAVFEDPAGLPIDNASAIGELDTAARLEISERLALAVQALHRRGLMAGCVDPGSVLYSRDPRSVTLTDLGFAGRIADESGTGIQIRTEALPLAYASPEMTGRLNIGPDHRSDLYSLGAAAYRIFTGTPPFTEEDPLELVHRHLTVVPQPAIERNPDTPEMVSRILQKLLEKQPDGRYRSASGVVADLRRCSEELRRTGSIPLFETGGHDIPDRLTIPEKLYGRSQEMDRMAAVFGQICDGPPALLLVRGYSGIGKTSLIEELSGPVLRAGGNFISGKFDQVARGVPFGALIQAFRGLVNALLTLEEEDLAKWKAKLASALGNNGGVLTEVIPELELVLGEQIAPPELGPQETLNRMQLVFQNFLSAVSSSEHPLVVFLDDLQWADAATLHLLKPLFRGSGELRHFLLIGAYRDNEVDVTHPLSRTLDDLDAAGVDMHRIDLGPLERSDLRVLIRETLGDTDGSSTGLSELVWEKTAGNPFFVIQFLRTLKQENLLRFDYDRNAWVYDVAEIAGSGMTDNVIDLMTRKIRRLSEGTQRALTLASCIGNRFSETMLSVISGETAETISQDLAEAVSEGLVLVAGRGTSGSETRMYSFLHDRVQQAAQVLLSDHKRQMVHLTVGRLLVSTSSEEQLQEDLFDIVSHLNRGRSLIEDEEELVRLAELNHLAGMKAKATAAFDASLEFFETGAETLSRARRTGLYDLEFSLRLSAAECAYLCGDLDESGSVTDSLLAMARNKLDRAKVLNLRMVRFENRAEYGRAIETARECLMLFGVSFPESDEEKDNRLEQEIGAIERLIAGRPIAGLVDLPEMEDPEMRMVMNILTDIWSPTYIIGDALLARLISATLVRISLTHGSTAESAYGYVTHAITVGPVRGDYETALEYGRLALAVNERFGDTRRRAKVHQQFHAHVALWRMPFSVCVAHAREATRSGLEAGDFLYAAYGAMTETWSALPIAGDLDEFVETYLPGLELIRKLKVNSFGDAHRLILNWALAFAGKTYSPTSLSNEDFDEADYERTYEGNPFFTMFLSVARLDLCYGFGDIDGALAEAERAEGLARHLSGTIWPVFLDIWGGLARAKAAAQTEEGERRERLLASARNSLNRLEVLAKNCPENYRVRSLLLSAEIAKVSGDETEALRSYELAADFARGSEDRRGLAMTFELFGDFWTSRGNPMFAAACVSEAIHNYTLLKADAKVRDLKERFPGTTEQSVFDRTAGAAGLDAASVIKAAQAMTGELELDNLIETLMRIVSENAGAERAVLLLELEDGLKAVAEWTGGGSSVMTGSPVLLADFRTLPHSLVNYTHRTLQNVVVDQAGRGTRYESDPYLAHGGPLSAMTVPLIGRGSLKGILYLENGKVSGAFTEETVRICGILASQAAVPLENAALYHEMKKEAAQRRDAERTLRSITEGTAAVTGDSFFVSLVSHLAQAFEAGYAFVTEFPGGESREAQMLAFWCKDSLADAVSFDVRDTPCERVLTGEACFYARGVKDLFPNDLYLTEIDAQGYWGIPLRRSTGDVIGHIAVIDDKPMVQQAQGRSLLNIFAARAGAELERMQAERELQKALEELEKLKDRLEDENVYLREEIRQSHNFEEIIGESPALLAALRDVERVASTDATVLVTGETGTGKELIARAVHNHSARKNRPLVKVNCAAISAGLVESELFGHTKGAFTGAVEKRSGRFELADGGTIFLDEVGELPPETQVKILRVLQEGEFEPVGSSRTVKVDVRVIAATNRDLESEVSAGRFRSDLFYRLNVFPVHVPPLRSRREDVPALVTFFLERYSKSFGKSLRTVPRGVMRMLTDYDWPGNVRELQNLIERAVVLASPDVDSLKSELIPVLSGIPEASAYAGEPLAVGASASGGGNNASLEDIERQHILTVLDRTGWVIGGDKGAASVLDLHPNTLRSRMKKLGIRRPTAS